MTKIAKKVVICQRVGENANEMSKGAPCKVSLAIFSNLNKVEVEVEVGFDENGGIDKNGKCGEQLYVLNVNNNKWKYIFSLFYWSDSIT